jgi:hypothetical protein
MQGNLIGCLDYMIRCYEKQLRFVVVFPGDGLNPQLALLAVLFLDALGFFERPMRGGMRKIGGLSR